MAYPWYFVEWMAPNWKDRGHMKVRAYNKVDAIQQVKKKLGKKVKAKRLRNFNAVREP